MEMNFLRKISNEIMPKIYFIFGGKFFLKNKGRNIFVKNNVAPQQIKDLFQILFEQEVKDLKNEMTLINAVRKSEPKKSKAVLEESKVNAQMALFDAVSFGGGKKDSELRGLLSNLILSKIEASANGEELQNALYKQAILTIKKLTINQLKIITLCYLLRHTSHSMVQSWDTFKIYLNTRIKPFLDFKNSDAEFQRVEFSSCGILEAEGKSYADSCRTNYSFLFLNCVNKWEIDSLNIPYGVKQQLCHLDEKEDKYIFKARNKIELENFLKDKNLSQALVERLLSIYEAHIKDSDEVESKIMKETDIGKDLVEACRTALNRLSLTSVGIAIATSYFEQITGEKVEMGMWNN